jgi:hypothetical protein
MTMYPLIRSNIPEHLKLHQHSCENLTAHARSSQKFMMMVITVVMMMMMIMMMT